MTFSKHWSYYTILRSSTIFHGPTQIIKNVSRSMHPAICMCNKLTYIHIRYSVLRRQYVFRYKSKNKKVCVLPR